MSIFNKSQYNVISKVLNCDISDIKIHDNSVGGMTNSSILIDVKSKKYIVRLPGKGSNELIDRIQEYKIYKFLHDIEYDDLTIFISKKGMKISKYVENSHNCDPNKLNEVISCITKLRKFHELELTPNVKYFSLIDNINKYRKLAKIKNEIYHEQVEKTYMDCVRIAKWIEQLPKKCCLCQIDANPDNTIFNDKSKMPILIDWEYAGLQDPHIDIAMWATYCNYNEQQFDVIINHYFHNKIDNNVRYKIYGYAALAGILWYYWCVYKLQLGVTYGDYMYNQLEYAKKYSSIVLRYLCDNRNQILTEEL